MTDTSYSATPAEILRRYAAGERVFRELDIGGPDSFRGAILDGVQFIECFIDADFSGASLRGARLHGNVKCCVFDGADLREADFRGTAIDAATFAGAKLEGARFEGAGYHSHVMGPGELPEW